MQITTATAKAPTKRKVITLSTATANASQKQLKNQLTRFITEAPPKTRQATAKEAKTKNERRPTKKEQAQALLVTVSKPKSPDCATTTCGKAID